MIEPIRSYLLSVDVVYDGVEEEDGEEKLEHEVRAKFSMLRFAILVCDSMHSAIPSGIFGKFSFLMY